MSTGCVPLLKAAPEPEQIADRLDGGGWRGLELCLAAKHVASDEALDEAIRVSSGLGVALTAEAPVGWPSGAFVRVDRLDEETLALAGETSSIGGNICCDSTPTTQRSQSAADQPRPISRASNRSGLKSTSRMSVARAIVSPRRSPPLAARRRTIWP